MNAFQAALRKKKILLLDGPMGTELERRGVPTPLPAWSAKAILTHPATIEDIYKDYLKCGADIITTNTFRTNRRAMRNAGMDGAARSLTSIAVGIARRAVENYATRNVIIAGSVAPVEDCYRPDLVPSDPELFAEHSELIGWLAEEGVDLILIETMNTLREARAAIAAAQQCCSLPVLVSLAIGDDGRLLGGEALAGAAAELAALLPDALLLNCALPTTTTTAIGVLAATGLPFGAYANAGVPGTMPPRPVPPEEYCEEANRWLESGASIVGGCCGTTPAYICALRRHIDERIARS